MTEEEAVAYLKPRLKILIQCTNDNIALNKAISALEKQIPKKPKGDYHSVPHYRCPTCNSSVKLFDNSPKSPICLSCWQRIDWGEE